MHDTIIYEAHVKGLTPRHPDVPEEMRGTYSAIAHPAVIDHLSSLGITAIELMPVHQFVHDHHLVERGLRNYWGYNSIAFLAPHNGYTVAGHGSRRPIAAAGQVQEFKTMVKALHAAGIEVILDVVYNHTAEGNHMGPMLSMRGIDNLAYYRVVDDDPRHYLDFTGTGNSLNMRHPHVLQLIMDSLRYWVTEMHVDGFRFDLASTLARELLAVDRLSAFFDLVQQDPVVSQVKLIAEPWDIGEGGYQVGNFPPLWSEWNGRYRDTIRDFWRGEPATLAEFGYRFTGSSDLYEADTRRPTASINFVTAHDGFTLRDLVSYNEKHNEANGEDNRDGESHNRSWNCGVEGETDDEAIARPARPSAPQPHHDAAAVAGRADDPRRRRARAHPGRQQQRLLPGHRAVVARLGRRRRRLPRAGASRSPTLRRSHPVFRRRRWFQGRRIRDIEDLAWFRPDGDEMSEDDWETGYARARRRVPQRRRHPHHGRVWWPDRRRQLLRHVQRQRDRPRPGPCRSGEWARRLGRRARHRPRPRARHGGRRPAPSLALVARSMVVLRVARCPTAA